MPAHRTTSTAGHERSYPAPWAAQSSPQLSRVYYSPRKVTFNLHQKFFCPCLKPQPYLRSCFILQADPFPHIPHPPHNQTPFPDPPFVLHPPIPHHLHSPWNEILSPEAPPLYGLSQPRQSLWHKCCSGSLGAGIFRPNSGKPLRVRLSVCH